MTRKYFVVYLNTAANGNEQLFDFETPDNDIDQQFVGLFVPGAIVGLQIGLRVSNNEQLYVDAAGFVSYRDMVDIDVRVPRAITPKVTTKDLAAGAHVNLPVVIAYTVNR